MRVNPNSLPQNSPIGLVQQVALANAGEMKSANAVYLENPYRTPVWVDEIRFELTDTDPASNASTPGLGLITSVKLDLGRNPLTNNYLPLAMLCQMLNNEEMQAEVFTFRLPAPLWLPSGEIVKVQFLSTLFGQDPTRFFRATSIRLSINGRSIPYGTTPPQTINLPWVTAYVGAPVSVPDGTAVTASQESTKADLQNSFEGPLHVKRFVGRLLSFNNGPHSNERNVSEVGSYGLLQTQNVAQVAERYVRVRLTNTDGQITAVAPTPFAHLFSSLDRSWAVNTLLRPKGFYVAQVDFDVPAFSDENGAAHIYVPMISMIGHREVVLV